MSAETTPADDARLRQGLPCRSGRGPRAANTRSSINDANPICFANAERDTDYTASVAPPVVFKRQTRWARLGALVDREIMMVSPHGRGVDTVSQRRNRYLIIGVCLIGMILIALRAIERGTLPRTAGPARSPYLVRTRFEQFGEGKIVHGRETEGDFKRAGYVKAEIDQVRFQSQCESYVPAYTAGCLQWLQDIEAEAAAAHEPR